MNTTIVNYVNSLNRRTFTNNVQRVLHTLLTAGGDGWVSRNSMRVSSAAARIRDLRKEEFGGFSVVCRSASSLGRKGDRHTFFYKVDRRNLTLAQVRSVFENAR
jgi:hypothetical protein